MKGNLGRIAVIAAVFIVAIILFSSKHQGKVQTDKPQLPNISNMPIVIESDPQLAAIQGLSPVEQRGEKFREWLQASFKIKVSGASGSGTLCYYDYEKNIAYVISCGHLWSGNMRARVGNTRKATVITWYHNDKKLSSPKEYEAEVHFYSNSRGYDISLLTFKPDWFPQIYFPIAPLDHKVGGSAHSMGCDGGEEVAHYEVEIVGLKDTNLITKNNSPRPGRSGGGLVDNTGHYIGICWGTSKYDGSGIGYFTPLKAIHEQFKKEGYEFLLGLPPASLARQIPIIDMPRHTKGDYPHDYIPLPGYRI